MQMDSRLNLDSAVEVTLMDVKVPRVLLEPENEAVSYVATCHFEPCPESFEGASEKSWSRDTEQIAPVGRNDMREKPSFILLWIPD